MKNPKLRNTKTCYTFEFSNGFTYDVPKEMMRTKQQFVDWYSHLSGKNWFTEKLGLEFSLMFIMEEMEE